MIRETGRYEVTTVTGEAVRAFVPFPLPPLKPALDLDQTTLSLLVQAQNKLADLNAAIQMVPSLDWFIYAYVRKEAVTSSQIEGTQATLIDLLSFEADEEAYKGDDPDIEEVCNYLDAIKYAWGQMRDEKGLPISIRFLNEVHKKLMKGSRGGTKQPGEIRKSQNWIGGSRPGNASFVPPPPAHLKVLLTELEKYIHENEPDGLPPLIRIGLLHVQFETIHPYLDGNGRIGRLLILLLLKHWELLEEPLLYLSLYFKKNRNEYYRLLGNVRLSGDWESWTHFFLEGIAEIAHDAVTLARHLSQIVREDREKILNQDDTTIITLRLFELLPTHPLITVAQVVTLLGVSKPTAAKAVAALEKLKILQENTGLKKNRIFKYSDYLAKLKFGTGLVMYRIVLHYAHEDFTLKDGKVEYAAKDGYDLFFESPVEAEKYFKKVIQKLKKGSDVESVELQQYDSVYNNWKSLHSSLAGKVSKRSYSSTQDDKLALQEILKKIGL